MFQNFLNLFERSSLFDYTLVFLTYRPRPQTDISFLSSDMLRLRTSHCFRAFSMLIASPCRRSGCSLITDSHAGPAQTVEKDQADSGDGLEDLQGRQFARANRPLLVWGERLVLDPTIIAEKN